MNWDQIEVNWTEVKGDIKQHWEKLSFEQLEAIGGKRDHLVDKIQVMYGINHEEAEHQLSDWQEVQTNVGGRIY